MLRGKDMHHVHSAGKQRVHKMNPFNHTRVVANDRHVLVQEHGQIGFCLRVAQSHFMSRVGSDLLATSRHGGGEEQGSCPHQTEFVHQLEDAFGDGGVGFGGGDLMQRVSPLARQQGVKTLEELWVVVKHVLQIGGTGMPYLLSSTSKSVHPATECGLGLFQLVLGHHHKPPTVACTQEPAMPRHRIVDGDDIPFFPRF